MTANHSNHWLIKRPHAAARLRLYCFPYAGGSAASFLSWQAHLPKDIEVRAIQMAGRGVRRAEKPHTVFQRLVSELAAAIVAEPRVPFAFFGHSLGALVAFEITRYMRLMQIRGPQMLIVSGCQSPRAGSEPRKLKDLPDAELIEELRHYNGTPSELMVHEELMALVLPVIRADFALVENYRYRPGILIDQPLHVFAGMDDPLVPRESVEPWLVETSAPGQVHWFEGDHFFIDQQQAAVLRCLGTLLKA